MIKFNELRITPDNENLIIDVSIEDADYYRNVVIDSIVIDTQDTFSVNGPSSNAVYTYIVNKESANPVYSLPDNAGFPQVQDEESGDYIYTIDDYHKKHTRLILKSSDLKVPIAGNMFFVYAITSGEPAEDTPCALKQSKIIGTAVNLYPIYKQSIAFTKELGNTCNIPKGFIDYILRIKALDLSIRTGNYPDAILYWNKIFKKSYYTSVEPDYNCGCYGKSN